jgi:hypothetical protein
MRAPTLPTEISPDGKEIWDWADRFSKHVHRQDRIAKLTREIAKIGRVCGDCSNWMKSRQCPKEHNVGGISRGPSCEGPTCKSFVETSAATTRRDQLSAELAALEMKP